MPMSQAVMYSSIYKVEILLHLTLQCSRAADVWCTV